LTHMQTGKLHAGKFRRAASGAQRFPRDELDVGAGNAEIVKLTIGELIKLAHGGALTAPILDFMGDVPDGHRPLLWLSRPGRKRPESGVAAMGKVIPIRELRTQLDHRADMHCMHASAYMR